MTFYKLEISRQKEFIEGSDANDWESVVCMKNPGHQRAGRRIGNLSLDILARNILDFARTMLSDVVVTDHARDVLERAELTGFIFEPTDVTGALPRRDGVAFPRLWELVVVGQGGPAHKDSGIAKLRECSECGLVEYSAFEHGIVVDVSRYDGSDFFTVVEYPKYILVSERAKAVIQANRLTNVTFIESTQLQWPKGVVAPR
jgi:Protein of unknown function (Gmx_para_CXXCG)